MGHVLRMGERGGSRRRHLEQGKRLEKLSLQSRLSGLQCTYLFQALSCTVVHILSEGTGGGVWTTRTRPVGLRESPSLRDTWEP